MNSIKYLKLGHSDFFQTEPLPSILLGSDCLGGESPKTVHTGFWAVEPVTRCLLN
jgi:hypothetical protein